jgi:hypothetical protein
MSVPAAIDPDAPNVQRIAETRLVGSEEEIT